MSTKLRLAIGLAAGLGLTTSVAAQKTDETPTAPDITSQYSVVEADPENGFAIIETNIEGRDNPRDTLDCGSLAHMQQTTELNIFEQASTFIALGRQHELEQELVLQLGFGHETLADAYRFHADIIADDEYGTFRHAALMGADREVFLNAQREAGCLKPIGL